MGIDYSGLTEIRKNIVPTYGDFILQVMQMSIVPTVRFSARSSPYYAGRMAQGYTFTPYPVQVSDYDFNEGGSHDYYVGQAVAKARTSKAKKWNKLYLVHHHVGDSGGGLNTDEVNIFEYMNAGLLTNTRRGQGIKFVIESFVEDFYENELENPPSVVSANVSFGDVPF